MTHWERKLAGYAGKPIQVWIEDRSGEEQTKPKPYTLYKVQTTADGKHLQFYLNASQFISVPIFEEGQTLLERTSEGERFVSHDFDAKLHYWIYL